MPKPDPALLDPARYPYSCSIETRFGDIDVNQHINNVALVGLLEEARVRFHRESGADAAFSATSPMVASLTVEFLGQSYFPAAMHVHVAPARLGRTSYALEQLAIQEGRIVAYAHAIMVCTDRDGPMELPALFRERVGAWMLKP